MKRALLLPTIAPVMTHVQTLDPVVSLQRLPVECLLCFVGRVVQGLGMVVGSQISSVFVCLSVFMSGTKASQSVLYKSSFYAKPGQQVWKNIHVSKKVLPQWAYCEIYSPIYILHFFVLEGQKSKQMLFSFASTAFTVDKICAIIKYLYKLSFHLSHYDIPDELVFWAG